MAGVLPTILLKFDDGTGTYPTNMTSRLNLNSISVQPFGRADESTTATTTVLAITLQNNDGALTSGASLISVGQGVRLTYTVGSTTVNQFTGRVTSAQLSWEGGPAKKANLVVTAMDITAELGRRLLRSLLEQEILSDAPAYFYPLSEAAGATTAGDISNNGQPSLAIAGTGIAPTFGNTDSPLAPVGGSAVVLDAGQWLQATAGAYYLGSGGVSLECFVSTAATTAALVAIDDGNSVGAIGSLPGQNVISVGISGGLLNARVTQTGADWQITSINISDDALHHVAVTITSAGFISLYVDGTLQASGATTALPAVAFTRIRVGNDNAPLNDTLVGSISNVAGYSSVLSAARVAAHASIATSLEATDVRLSRLAGYAGLTSVTVSGSGQIVGWQDTADVSVLDAMEAVALAEGGLLFVDGSGQLTMQGRYYRSLQVAATLALQGRDLDPGSTAITLDVQQVINQVTATRVGGAQQVAINQTSITNSGAFPQSADLAVAADSDALGYAQWTVAKHASASPRMAAVTFNMFTSPDRENILGASVGARTSISSMPSQLFTGFGDVTLEGWSDSFSVSGSNVTWTRTANLLPWSLFEVFILNNTTYGVLDSAVPIGY